MSLRANIVKSMSDPIPPVLSVALLLLVSSEYGRTCLKLPSLSWKEVGILYIGGQMTRIAIETGLRQANVADESGKQLALAVAFASVALCILFLKQGTPILSRSQITISMLGYSALIASFVHSVNTVLRLPKDGLT